MKKVLIRVCAWLGFTLSMPFLLLLLLLEIGLSICLLISTRFNLDALRELWMDDDDGFVNGISMVYEPILNVIRYGDTSYLE